MRAGIALSGGECEVGGLVPIGHHPHLGHAHLVIAVDVGDHAALEHGFLDLARVAGHGVPVPATDAQLDGKTPAAAGAEALLGGIHERDADARDRGRLAPDEVQSVRAYLIERANQAKTAPVPGR